MNGNEYATLYALTTAIGLRPFLVLALASLAMHFGYLHPSGAFAKLGSDGATWLFAGLAVLEFAGDKIPVVDHALQAMHFAIKPLAAAILVDGAIPAGTPDGATYALMALGAANALGVHTGVTAMRGASTVATLGVANPVVSVIEDILAIGAALLAFIAPYLGAIGAVLLSIVIVSLVWRVYRGMRRRVPAR